MYLLRLETELLGRQSGLCQSILFSRMVCRNRVGSTAL